MSDKSAAQFHDDLLLLAEKLGELNDRFGRIEAEFSSQAAPLDASQKALEGTVTALNAALTGIKALNFHVLDNNLGAVSSRVAELSRQTDIALRALDSKVDEHQRALAAATTETAKKFSAQDEARVELARVRDSQAKQFAQQVESVREEFSRHLATLAEDVKKFATPTSFNPRGSWDALTSYSRLDIAELNGSSYVSIVDGNKDKPGKNSRTWTLLARRGGSVSGGGGISDITGIAGFTPIGLQIAQASDAANARTILGVADMVGATASVNGAAGRVPQPIAGDQSKFLRGDGTFATPSVVTASAATNAQAIAGTATDVYNTPASGNARALLGDLTRRINDIALSDGATSNRRMQQTPGAAGNLAGAPAASWVGMVLVPPTNPSAVAMVTGLLPNGVSAQNTAWTSTVYFDTSGGLLIRANAATGSDNRIFTHSTFRNTYAGQWVLLEVRLTKGTGNPVALANGVNISSSFALTTLGAPPEWLDASLTSTVHVTGHTWPSGFAPITINGGWANAHLTDAESLAWAQTGVPPSWWLRDTGNVARFVSDMSSTTGWLPTGTSSISGGKLTIPNDASTAFFGSASGMNIMQPGMKMSFTVTVDSITGGGSLAYWNGSAYVPFANAAGTYTVEFTVIAYYSSGPGIRITGGSGGEAVLDNYTGRIHAPFTKPVPQPGCAVMTDSGANGIPTLLTPGMSIAGALPEGVAIPTDVMSADGFVLADQVIVPAGYELTRATLTRLSGSHTGTITVRETSSGGTTVATATSASGTVAMTISNPLLVAEKKLHVSVITGSGSTYRLRFRCERTSSS